MTYATPVQQRNAAIETAFTLAHEYLATLPTRKVGAHPAPGALERALGGPLPAAGTDPAAVIALLAELAEPGLVASAGPRYFGFVTGGVLPAALGADWLTSAWDQNACLYAMSPAAAAVETVAGGWLVDLLGLPSGTGVGFTSDATMANFAALAAARHALLARAGWDVEADGLAGAPPLTVLAGACAHASIAAAVQMLGLGRARTRRVAADPAGRMLPAALADALERATGPCIVCTQAGEVNTGSFDPFDTLVPIAHRHGAWLHVDGAFGLWAAAAPTLRHLVRGMADADSWTVDGHKWLNVPYDSGYALVRDGAALRAALASAAPYLEPSGERENSHYVPESSRRARGFATWAALRSLGRDGVAALVERCCACARRMADALRAEPGIEVLNAVVLNQVLLRFHPATGDGDAFTRHVLSRIQAEGTCWFSGTTWQGHAAARISISNWSTTEADIDRSARAIVACLRSARLRWT